MKFLTSMIISKIAWDEIKVNGKVTKEYIETELCEWAITEKLCGEIAERINNIPDDEKRSQKFLEAIIDEDLKLTKILSSIKKNCTYNQNNNESAIQGSNLVNGSNNTTIINNFSQDYKKRAEIKIVNIDIERDEEGVAILDIKLRNTGDEISFLKKVIFNVYDFYEMINPSIIQYSRVESSYTYDIALCGLDKKEISISQSIAPNEVDRFKIKIANQVGDDPQMPTIYKFSISIICNEDNSCVESDKMILSIRPLMDWVGSYTNGWLKENASKNYINLKRFNEENIYKCDWFIGLYNSYEKNKSDFM